MSDAPSWLASSATTGAQAPAAGVGARPPAAPEDNISSFGIFWVRFIHVVNILLCALLAWSGVVGLTTKTPTEVFIGLYVLLFAAMLFAYEILRFFPEHTCNHKMKGNFGWLYGYLGLGAFLIFAGALNFGLRGGGLSEKHEKLTLWTGITTCGWGLVTIVTYLGRPEWFTGR